MLLLKTKTKTRLGLEIHLILIGNDLLITVRTTMQRQPTRRPLGIARQAADQRYIDKCNNGVETSFLLLSHQRRQREQGVNNIKREQLINSIGFVLTRFYPKLMAMELPNINWRSVLMTTSESTATNAKVNSQVIDPLDDPIQAILPHIEKKLNGKNWSAFEFGFVAHLIEYNLVNVLIDDEAGKAKNNKIY